MGRYIFRRIIAIIPMMIIISTIIFVSMYYMPGDPFSYNVDPDILKTQMKGIEELREEYGLNDPLLVQYARWIGKIVKGDLGFSLSSRASIADSLAFRLPATLELGVAGLFFATVIGVAMGFIAAIRKNTYTDYSNTFFSMLGISIPGFFLGLLLIVLFAFNLKILPASGRLPYDSVTIFDRLPNLILPMIALSVSTVGHFSRLTRGSMLDVLTADYIKTARSKGLSSRRVFFKHAFRNAFIPVMLSFVFVIPAMFGGSIVIEQVFNWGGMGIYTVGALTSKDYPVVMVTLMLSSFIVLICSTLADIFAAFLDPRVRLK